MAALLVLQPHAASLTFFVDDPLPREEDPYDASRVTVCGHLSWDLISSLFGKPGELRGAAANVNTIDEVPDSSWFTNGPDPRPLTDADVGRGPDITSDPRPASGPSSQGNRKA